MKSVCRKPCKECPSINTDKHSVKFNGYVEKLKSIGVNGNACHMITKDIWGYSENINDENVCIGYLKSIGK